MSRRSIAKRGAERQERFRPTDAERVLAARIRVHVDKRQKQPTPRWIVDLAQQGKRTA